jgi:hypothetical protein
MAQLDPLSSLILLIISAISNQWLNSGLVRDVSPHLTDGHTFDPIIKISQIIDPTLLSGVQTLLLQLVVVIGHHLRQFVITGRHFGDTYCSQIN